MRNLNLKGFTEIKQIGHGSYGSVFKARRHSDNVAYAVKAVNLNHFNQKEIQDSLNEIRLMASFTSPFIIRFYEAFCDNKRLCIVTEYARLGDLAHLIERRKRKNKPFTEDQIWCYFLQMLEGLNVLHSSGVIHRDLKSANILISAPDLIKIGDLGISTVLQTTQLAKTQIGTPLYLAPEVWKKRPYNQKCDIWSLGVLLYEMMTFSYPFPGRSNSDIAHRVCRGNYTIPQGKYSNDLVSVLRRLLQVNPVVRPSVKDLLNMQVIKNRLPMLDPFIEEENLMMNEKLLDTIKVPQNLRNVNLPMPTYNKKADIIKPIEQRLHMKKGVPLKKEIHLVNSPEMQMITDYDWWAPTKPGNEDQEEVVEAPEIPLRSKSNQVRSPKEIRRKAPRRFNAPGGVARAIGQEQKMRNPRFKRQAIR
ncbi:AGC family protein kinase [Tritrichomonas foetus]|uniref:non-specific serine/threonine protein kinase n=1 Tax=Tritrichomonas foetus TaxID=1144522 RepID=A0A1J4KMT7_9EUKA|nr:AGC family protein kinase [Tritrichomonas foetus]|eukprot:OHT11014.1 AGC family protein kinase [Tritrichomonas foetus]